MLPHPLAEEGIAGGAGDVALDLAARVFDELPHATGAVVLPRSTAEVQAAVHVCAKHKIAFGARGAGTGLSGVLLCGLSI
ncbi:MAG: FAD-binding protein [Edaphobacter sp.]